MNDVSWRPTPIKRRAGERAFRKPRTALDERLDKQYSFGWPMEWSRDRENRVLPGLYVGGYEAARAATEHYDLVVNMDGGIPERLVMQRDRGGRYAVYAIGDGSTLPDLDAMWALARMVRDELLRSAESRVLIHCAAGINRSAFLCAMVVMLVRNVDGAAALAEVRRHRMGALANPTFAKWLTDHGRPTRRHRGR